MPPAAGCLPLILSPASHAMRLARPSAAASSAEMRMTGGRSPGGQRLEVGAGLGVAALAAGELLAGGDGPLARALGLGRRLAGAGSRPERTAAGADLAPGGLAAGADLAAAVGLRGRGGLGRPAAPALAATLRQRRPRWPERSARAAASGSGASVIARTTAIRVAPAARTAADVAGVDPADGEERRGGVGGGVAHQVQPHRGAAGLGRRGVDGADPDVVDLGLGAGRVDLRGRVGGQPDDAVGTDQGARLRHRHVVLADVDAVGAGCGHQVGPVVEDERHAVRAAHRARSGARWPRWPRRSASLSAQLDDVDAPAQRLLQEGIGLLAADEVQPRGLEGVADVGHAPSAVCQPSPLALASAPYGSPTVGLRGRTPIRRPSGPDRVMPAQGGPLSEQPADSRCRRHRWRRDRPVRRLARGAARPARRRARARPGRATAPRTTPPGCWRPSPR